MKEKAVKEIGRTFVTTSRFEKDWKSLGFSDEDQRQLELMILERPDIGDLVVGTGGLRKMRFAFSNRGKSGSARVCYVDFIVAETVYLIAAFSKKDQANLTKAEKNQIRKVIASIERNLREVKKNE